MEMNEAVIIAVGSAIGSALLSWGAMGVKVQNIKEAIKDLKTHIERVERDAAKVDYLHAITDPLQAAVREIRVDLREILGILRK